MSADALCRRIFDEHSFNVDLGEELCIEQAHASSSCVDASFCLPLYLASSGINEPESVAADLIALASRVWSEQEWNHMSLRVALASDSTVSSEQLWSFVQFSHICLELLPQYLLSASSATEHNMLSSQSHDARGDLDTNALPDSLANLAPPPRFSTNPTPSIEPKIVGLSINSRTPLAQVRSKYPVI